MYLNYWEKFELVIEQFDINRNDICIVGSSVLAYAGIRENRDIDFAMHPLARKDFLNKNREKVEVLKSGTIRFSSYVQSGINRYGKIGLIDEELFDEQYSIRKDGFRIARLELEIAQKIERNLEKDRKHMQEMGDSYFDIEGFDRQLFKELTSKKRAIIFGAGANARLAYHCYSTRFELLCYVDNKRELWGTEINGLQVCSPDIFKDTDAIIIISSQQYAEDIKKEIYLKFGKRKVISFTMKEDISFVGDNVLY